MISVEKNEPMYLESKNAHLKFNEIFIAALFILFGSIVSIILVGSAIAHAHSIPVTEVPATNSIISKGAPLPSRVIIDFSERPNPNVSTIQVLNSKNQRVDKGDFVIIGDHDRQAMTTLDTHKLTDGVYTVAWMTQSNDDGHVARGSYVFGIGNVVGPGPTSGFNGTLNHRQPQVTAVTSNLDGIIKWPLIVSQTTIVGGIFSHFFLWEIFGNRIGRRNNTDDNNNGDDKIFSEYNNKANLPWLKRFSIVLVASSVAIIASVSSLIFLQVIELSSSSSSSSNSTISAYLSVFNSLLYGSAGITWLVQTITAVAIIACSLAHYYLSKRQFLAGTSNIVKGSPASMQQGVSKKMKVKPVIRATNIDANLILTPRSGLLYCALVMGAISIFASSANSHNAGVSFLPSAAVFIDWLHFMAVSIWIGGLFYISTILLSAIRARIYITRRTTTTTTIPSTNSSRLLIYHLAILLPRFSIIATASLGIIGITGLYMGWIQLHSFNNLFDTPYGNILIIKLSTVLPLVLLGAYHQLRVHRSIVTVTKLGNANTRTQVNDKNAETIQKLNNNNSYDRYTNPIDDKAQSAENEKTFKDVSSKFSRTIKIESLLAISVLLIASLLTITSPPSKMSSMAMMNMPSSSSSSNMRGMPMTPIKDNAYIKETTIMNVNTKIEITPFYSGFNTFKVSFTDTQDKPNTKVSSVTMAFRNDQAGIGPIAANFNQTGPGLYAITGGYLSQPGQWDISIAAQRVNDYDLNYKLTLNVTAAPSATSSVTHTGNNNNNNIQEAPPPKIDSFTYLAIGLAIAVGAFSMYSYKRSKHELRNTIQMLEPE